MTIEMVSENEFEVERWQKKPSAAKYPHAKEIFALFKNYVPSWKINRTFCISAENLYLTRGVADCKDALEFAEKHKKEPFCPQIHTPYDLDMKWDKLVEYSLKNK